MTAPPSRPAIYHITHVDNLPAIVADGRLVSDAIMVARGGPNAPIGMSTIKQRRMSLSVACHPGDHVGQYVPFYFCPRSIMLYVIHRANHAELAYRGGQELIVHLQADLHQTVQWAESNGRRWAFSLCNAGAAYAEFRDDLANLNELDWKAIASHDFREREVKEAKQAEFLVRDDFPWHLVEAVVARSQPVARRAATALANAPHRPMVRADPGWYF